MTIESLQSLDIKLLRRFTDPFTESRPWLVRTHSTERRLTWWVSNRNSHDGAMEDTEEGYCAENKDEM